MTASQAPNPVVVVPLHRRLESVDGKLSLAVLQSVLGAHPIVGAVPQSLADLEYWTTLGVPRLEIFEDGDFASIQAYNLLMLDARFYRRFSDYSHVLLYQSDALVFSDELLRWCASPYDYIGAPWAYRWAYWPAWLNSFKRARAGLYRWMDWRDTHRARLNWCALRVGNGGLSLRRVDRFLEVLEHAPPALADYRTRGLPGFPEDFFWGIDVNRDGPRLRVPDWHTALGFAVESAPPQAVQQLGRLPFGVHAWDRGYRDYWLKALRSTSCWAGLPAEIVQAL
jgi:hypothetical protein